MIVVKNVTTYTVYSIVAKQGSYTSLLSQLKEFSRVDNEPQLITRKEWANRLQINRKTVERWEKYIINSQKKFAYLYYNGNLRKGRVGLDWYQRFFLALIYSLLEGVTTGTPMTYEEAIAWLEGKEGKQPRWMGLTRQEFQKWSEFYEQRQAS